MIDEKNGTVGICGGRYATTQLVLDHAAAFLSSALANTL